MKIVYASSTARVSLEGAGVLVQKGQHWSANDPVVRSFPDLFSTDPRYGLTYTTEPDGWDDPPDSVRVETATAAPGERRNTGRRSTY